MQDWQKRVVMEKHSLDEKIERLDAFLLASGYGVSAAEITRLVRQKDAMETYSMILGERIAAFEGGGS